jgi:Lar family restriction alleviation protein
MSKIKPCPFCGEQPIMDDAEGLEEIQYWFRCDCCGFSFSSSQIYEHFDSEEDLISQWNIRVPESELQSKMVKMQKNILLYLENKIKS